MVTLVQLQVRLADQTLTTCDYQTTAALNVYDTPDLSGLSTQALPGRYLRFGEMSTEPDPRAIPIRLREDHYPGWIDPADLRQIEVAVSPYCPMPVSTAQIQERIPAIIDFAKATLTVPNTYFWGGTLGPNYDCSGLMQRAYGSQGIWLPRDSYQQHDFTVSLTQPGSTPAELLQVLQPGDLIFFGSALKTDHVALYLGEGQYIHSSGQERGRNQIALDRLDESDSVRQAYYQRLRGGGRVVQSYHPPY